MYLLFTCFLFIENSSNDFFSCLFVLIIYHYQRWMLIFFDHFRAFLSIFFSDFLFLQAPSASLCSVKWTIADEMIVCLDKFVRKIAFHWWQICWMTTFAFFITHFLLENSVFDYRFSSNLKINLRQNLRYIWSTISVSKDRFD